MQSSKFSQARGYIIKSKKSLCEGVLYEVTCLNKNYAIAQFPFYHLAIIAR